MISLRLTHEEALEVTHLQAWLEESSLSMQVFNECPPPDGRYVVWLFAADDPALGTFVGHDDDLALANVHKARKKARANR